MLQLAVQSDLKNFCSNRYCQALCDAFLDGDIGKISRPKPSPPKEPAATAPAPAVDPIDDFDAFFAAELGKMEDRPKYVSPRDVLTQARSEVAATSSSASAPLLKPATKKPKAAAKLKPARMSAADKNKQWRQEEQ